MNMQTFYVERAPNINFVVKRETKGTKLSFEFLADCNVKFSVFQF